MGRRKIALLGLAALAGAGPATGVAGAPPPLVIRGATLIDGTGRPPLPNACVVVRGGRVAAVGPLGRVPIPKGARVLAVPRSGSPPGGATLLPGFIDMHVHTSVHPGLMPYFLACGITSVRDLGCDEARLPELKRYRSEAGGSGGGGLPGPRLFLAGPPIDGVPRAASWFPGPSAVTPDEGRAAVRRLAAEGVDVIKLYRRLKPEVARAAIAEAHRLRLPVTWDYPWNYGGLFAAIHSGVDGLEHVFYSERASADETQQLAEQLAAAGIWYTPTLVAFRPPPDTAARNPDFERLPPSLLRFWHRLFWPMETDAEFAEMKRFVRLVHRNGGRLLAGTDTPVKHVAPGFAFHDELRLLAECGLTPMEALLAGTRDAARALRRERELGTVEPGKRADLVLLDGNPLADLRATRRVRWVLLGGRLHRPEALLAAARARDAAKEADLPRVPPMVHGE